MGLDRSETPRYTHPAIDYLIDLYALGTHGKPRRAKRVTFPLLELVEV